VSRFGHDFTAGDGICQLAWLSPSLREGESQAMIATKHIMSSLFFQSAYNSGLFGPFVIPKPYLTLDDIFCCRFKRTVDFYRRISSGVEAC